jgi:hypothetical protein
MRIPEDMIFHGGLPGPTATIGRENPTREISESSLGRQRVSVEIQSEKLLQLIQQRVLAASDLRCLDHASKAILRELCLSACLKQSRFTQQD